MATKSPPKTPPGRNGFRYRPKFGLVIVCRDEQHQAAHYRRLTALGYKPRVVAV